MSIREDIERKYKQSFKERNVNITNTIRLIKSAIKNKDIAVRSLEAKEEILLEKLDEAIDELEDSIED